MRLSDLGLAAARGGAARTLGGDLVGVGASRAVRTDEIDRAWLGLDGAAARALLDELAAVDREHRRRSTLSLAHGHVDLLL